MDLAGPLRHCAGPIDFTTDKAHGFDIAMLQVSRLVRQFTNCDRVYAIAFEEGAEQLVLHLIPRLVEEK